MIWIIVFVAVLFVGVAIWQSSPSNKLLGDKRPGKPGAVDPTGNPVPESADFKKPRDEGNLL